MRKVKFLNLRQPPFHLPPPTFYPLHSWQLASLKDDQYTFEFQILALPKKKKKENKNSTAVLTTSDLYRYCYSCLRENSGAALGVRQGSVSALTETPKRCSPSSGGTWCRLLQLPTQTRSCVSSPFQGGSEIKSCQTPLLSTFSFSQGIWGEERQLGKSWGKSVKLSQASSAD